MNCEQVRMILDDYLDGVMTDAETSAVNAHLKACDACREELAFLKKYRKAVGKFPTLQAPEDFLKKVHAGIDARKRGGIVRTLFFPLRVKVPLEAAALIALAVTGVLIFRPFRTGMLEYGAELPPAVSERQSAADETEKLTLAQNRAQALRERTDAVLSEKKREARRAPEREGAPVNVASSPEMEPKEKKSATDETEEITLSLRLNAAAEENAASGDVFVQERVGSAADARIETKESPVRTHAKKAETAAHDRAGIIAIDGLARTLGGKIIKQVSDDTTGAIRFVVVELPAGNFSRFIGELDAKWSILGQVPPAPHPGTGTVRINMHIQN